MNVMAKGLFSLVLNIRNAGTARTWQLIIELHRLTGQGANVSAAQMFPS
jgi:hypothetical protein